MFELLLLWILVVITSAFFLGYKMGHAKGQLDEMHRRHDNPFIPRRRP